MAMITVNPIKNELIRVPRVSSSRCCVIGLDAGDSALRRSGAELWCCNADRWLDRGQNKGELVQNRSRSTAKSNDMVDDELIHCW